MSRLRSWEEHLIKGYIWVKGIRDYRTIRSQAIEPERTQRDTLKRILNHLSETPLGRQRGLSKVKTYEEFKTIVAETDYEFYRPWVDEEMASGRPQLTPTPPLFYVRTSGTTGAAKHIPVTSWTLNALRRAQRISNFSYSRDIPNVFSGRILAITAPKMEATTELGIPISSMSGLVAAAMGDYHSSRYVVPESVLAIKEYDKKYLAIALYAAATKNISLIATANSTTLLRLNQTISENAAKIIKAIEEGQASLLDPSFSFHLSKDPYRAKEIYSIMQSGRPQLFSDLWPNLAAIITWTSGNCALSLDRTKELYSSAVKIAEMGYLASEFRGSITVDCLQPGGLPPIGDSFFEFLEDIGGEGGGEPKILSELEPGRRYHILASTGDGLLRYRINDIVEVCGKFESSPLIRFVQKGKGVTNLTGEKVYELHVIEALKSALKNLTIPECFYLMVADEDEMEYRLYLEATKESLNPSEIAAAVEKELGELNCEYLDKRRSSRLKTLQCIILPSGSEERYRRDKVASGQRENQLKFSKLEYYSAVKNFLEPLTSRPH